MTYYPRPKNPLREVLQAMTGSRPPKCARGYSSTELSDEEQEELHKWAVNHVKPAWLTGIGLIDAADAQIAEAVSNGNIPPPEKQPSEEHPVVVEEPVVEPKEAEVATPAEERKKGPIEQAKLPLAKMYMDAGTHTWLVDALSEGALKADPREQVLRMWADFLISVPYEDNGTLRLPALLQGSAVAVAISELLGGNRLWGSRAMRVRMEEDRICEMHWVLWNKGVRTFAGANQHVQEQVRAVLESVQWGTPALKNQVLEQFEQFAQRMGQLVSGLLLGQGRAASPSAGTPPEMNPTNPEEVRPIEDDDDDHALAPGEDYAPVDPGRERFCAD
jgi:hypothetical protein